MARHARVHTHASLVDQAQWLARPAVQVSRPVVIKSTSVHIGHPCRSERCHGEGRPQSRALLSPPAALLSACFCATKIHCTPTRFGCDNSYMILHGYALHKRSHTYAACMSMHRYSLDADEHCIREVTQRERD